MLPQSIVVLLLTFCAATFAQSNGIVISQIYGGGGNTGAPYRNDFIELFNRGSNSISIAGWSVQYAAAAGSTWQVTPISGTLQPGAYYLVQQASGGATGANLPTPDATGAISISATAGKVALVSNSVSLSGTCPTNSSIVDLVGYGTTASCSEGARAPAHSSTVALRRASEGCSDTQDNAADFIATEPSPRNTAAIVRICDFTTRIHAIHEIQGNGPASPLQNQFITTTTNIVTALRSDGFFIQTPDGAQDADPLTSEGIFVLSGDNSPLAVRRGDAVVVIGTVVEFKSASDPASPTRTQINLASVRSISASNALPIPVVLTANQTLPNGGHNQLEHLEGMRVSVDSLRVVSPTGGFVNEATATATSSGIFYGVLGPVPRPMREPGIDALDALPPNAPCCVPTFDGNPELLRIDSNGQLGASVIDADAGMSIFALTNVVHYESRRYTLLPDPSGQRQITAGDPKPSVSVPAADQLTIASLNLERFYDSIDDPTVSDVVLMPAAVSNRLQKTAMVIREVMHTPDVLGFAEVENLSILQSLAASIGSSPYRAWLMQGNDVGGINVGFLVNTARVSVLEVRQEGKNATFTHPLTFAQATLHDRPPLLLRVAVPGPRVDDVLPLTIVMNHLRSLIDIDDPEDGAFVRAKRRAQAEHIAQLVQQRQAAGEHVIITGDFNAFEFNDGYVDVIGTITGRPASSNHVLLASANLVEPDLSNLLETLPASERYSYVFNGIAQALDHILVSQSLRPRIARFLYVRNNADFAQTWRNIPERPERVSDHDPAMAYVTLGVVPRIVSIQRGPSEVILIGEANAARTFIIERSADLISWLEIGSAAVDETRRFTLTDTNPVSGAAFYRLRAD